MATALVSKVRTPLTQLAFPVQRSSRRPENPLYSSETARLRIACAPSSAVKPNYRQIVAENIATVFPNPAPLGTLEISGVWRTNHLNGPAWITCLKIHAENAPQEYAIFIQDGKIIDQRQGVLLDRCKQQTHQAYEPSSFIHHDSSPIQPKKAGH